MKTESFVTMSRGLRILSELQNRWAHKVSSVIILWQDICLSAMKMFLLLPILEVFLTYTR